MVVDKKSGTIICTTAGQGRRHDFHLYKNSKVRISEKVKLLADSGYQGIKKLHDNAELPKRNTKKKPLSKEDKKENQRISRYWLKMSFEK